MFVSGRVTWHFASKGVNRGSMVCRLSLLWEKVSQEFCITDRLSKTSRLYDIMKSCDGNHRELHGFFNDFFRVKLTVRISVTWQCRIEITRKTRDKRLVLAVDHILFVVKLQNLTTGRCGHIYNYSHVTRYIYRQVTWVWRHKGLPFDWKKNKIQ